MGNGKNKAPERRRYPGHRPCNNHELLDEMLKGHIPEMCPNCFAGIAKHQVQLVAMNYCKTYLLMNRVLEMMDRLEAHLAPPDPEDQEVTS